MFQDAPVDGVHIPVHCCLWMHVCANTNYGYGEEPSVAVENRGRMGVDVH